MLQANPEIPALMVFYSAVPFRSSQFELVRYDKDFDLLAAVARLDARNATACETKPEMNRPNRQGAVPFHTSQQ